MDGHRAERAGVVNHGLLLRSTLETSAPTPLPNSNVQNPFCGVVMLDVHKSSWSDLDLRNTQDSDDSNNPSFLPSTQCGLRLVVFYRNDNLLTLNQVKAFDLPGGGGTPPAGDPYYAADHLYKLPPFDDSMWQALVVRGLGQPQGQYPPPGDGFTYQRPLQGQLDVTLMSQNDKLKLRGVTSTPGGVGYILEIVQNPATGEAFLTSPIFPVQVGKWALVLSYNGPQIESWTVPDCEDEVCSKPPSKCTPIKYGMDISVHSCKDGVVLLKCKDSVPISQSPNRPISNRPISQSPIS